MANLLHRLGDIFTAGKGSIVLPATGSEVNVAAVERTNSVWLLRIAKSAILLAVFVAPLLYLPVAQDALFIKVVVVEVLAVVATTAWLLNILVVKRIDYKRNPLNAAFLILALVLVLASILSRSPWASFWGPDITGEKTASILSFIVIAFIAAATFGRKDVERAGRFLLFSLTILGILSLLSVAATKFVWQLPSWVSFNPIGTLNALAYVLAAGFVFSAVLVFSRKTSAGRELLSLWTGRLALFSSVVLLAAIAFIGFSFMWVGVALAMVSLIAFNFVKSWHTADGKKEFALSNIWMGVAFLVLVLGLFLTFRTTPLMSNIFQPPAEVLPSFAATLDIGKKVMAEKPLTGFGPANFKLAYNLYRDPALNNTVFWTARFNHGFSLATTLLSTVGLLGSVAFILFILTALWIPGRALLKSRESEPFGWAFMASSIFVAAMLFIYPSSFTGLFLLFISLGMLGAIFGESAGEFATAAAGASFAGANNSASSRPSWLSITPRSIKIDSPAVNFAVSLVIVFVSAFSLVAVYSLIAQETAEYYFSKAGMVLNLYGNTDSAKIFLDKAIGYNPTDGDYYQGKAQLAFVIVNRIIAQVAAGTSENLSGKFRDELTQGVNAAQKATVINPYNPQNWFVLGQLYESVLPVLPYLPGADKPAVDAYERARQDDPMNPVYSLASARVYLTVGDILTLQINQTSSGEDRSRLEQNRAEIWKKAKEALGETIKLKGDFAEAHYLLAQVSIRENNLSEAIRNTENTARLAPGDIGVAFQLGVLYYRANDIDKAKSEFDRAVAINDNYSNARYFLGLIWDRKGDKDAALSQFQKIFALNPNNEEVKRIIANLESGKHALEGIVPPAPAPENRKEAPIKEESTPAAAAKTKDIRRK